MQVIEQTREQKKKMYMKCTKSELAEMLIECNNVLTMVLEKNRDIQFAPVSPIIVNPAPSVAPFYPPFYTTCDSIINTATGADN